MSPEENDCLDRAVRMLPEENDCLDTHKHGGNTKIATCAVVGASPA